MDILLNDILQLSEIENTKVKFNVSNGVKDPIDIFKENREELLQWQFWNSSKRSYYEGQVTIGFVLIENYKWLLFDISRITKDLNKFNQVGYEYQTIREYEKYFGRIVIEFKENTRQVIRKAESVIDKCKVVQILESTFDDDLFPGYENVYLSWQDLKRVLHKNVWKTALENQKGVYLITDSSNGKMYVGSAYGTNMLHGRWSQYLNNGHGGNEGLKKLSFDHIKSNFYYSILDIYKSTIEDNIIIKRESWWKKVLGSKTFGYNEN
ncbi:GIY-YIG nuclease family protein [Tunicatimonas pelagia]|uniref:GIY-YIG nuclease family protein n=1 Tax=Tunicatimonas pelagia TaxID=931531 RepID=UPI0026671938|nr:GIY-YIG nuclease family protein [Tunicatimonas pelagia]WKN41709.1 GIY-YIG nuclease family protein [Tunicatimonas pelagia]